MRRCLRKNYEEDPFQRLAIAWPGSRFRAAELVVAWFAAAAVAACAALGIPYRNAETSKRIDKSYCLERATPNRKEYVNPANDRDYVEGGSPCKVHSSCTV